MLAEALLDRSPPATEGVPLYLDTGSSIYQVVKIKSLLFLKSLHLYHVVLCLTTGEGTWPWSFREEVSFSVVPLRMGTVSLASGKTQPLWSAGVSHTAHISHQPSPLLVTFSWRACHYAPSLVGSGPCLPVLPGSLMAHVIVTLVLILLDKVSAGKWFWIGSPRKRSPFGNALLVFIVYATVMSWRGQGLPPLDVSSL